MEKNLSKKDLSIDIKIDKIKVAKKDGSLVYVDGEWCDKIAIDDLNWTISSEGD